MPGPPQSLVDSLVQAGELSGLEWHEVATSTRALAAEAAARGAPELHAVLADTETAAGDWAGQTWQAPPGTSLLCSLVVRPGVSGDQAQSLWLLTGVALADVVEGAELEWPNVLLLGGRKVGRLLVEAAEAGMTIVSVAVNVDWRGVERPAEQAAVTSLAEATGSEVDRWELLRRFLRTFVGRYRQWQANPSGFIGDYRARCATMGEMVRLTLVGGDSVSGRANDLAATGALVLGLPYGATRTVVPGEVQRFHRGSASRPAAPTEPAAPAPTPPHAEESAETEQPSRGPWWRRIFGRA